MIESFNQVICFMKHHSERHKRNMAVAQRKHVPVFVFYRRKPPCLFVSWWFTIFHHGGTKTQRDTKNFVETATYPCS